MKKKKIRILYNRALSVALVVSTTASLCLGVSGVTAAMEEQRRAEEATEEVVSGERHHHTFACYEEYALDCTENHPENEHRKSCYRYSGERICGLEDGELHLHGPECAVAAKVLICGEDENVSGEVLDEQDEETTGETADNEDSGESTVDDGSVSGEIVDDGIEGGEVTDGGAEGGEVAGDGIDGDEIAGDEIAGDEITGNEITGDETAGDETNGGEDNAAGNTGEETNGSDSVESSEEETNGSDGAGEETLESGSAGEETTGSADAGKETTGSADAGKETTGSADAGKETTGSADAGEETTGSADAGEETMGSVDAEGSKEETDASDNVGEESSSGSNDKETADIENAEEETAASDSAGKETADLESAGKESASSENADGGNSGSGEWNNGEETSSGEKTNISAEKSGRDRFSLLAVNRHSYGSPLFPQLYIESPLNALLDKILPEEELLADEDGTVNETDNESETVNDETEKTEDADNGKEHQHSEECYKIIYQCRAGVATMALREGGVAEVGSVDTLTEALGNAEVNTIRLIGSFSIKESLLINRNMIIDLNGHKLSYDGTATNVSMIEVGNATLTIKDSANTQQSARKISEKIVSEAGNATYSEETGILTYYVTECSVNLDGKSTTNTIKKIGYDLGNKNDNIGRIECAGLEAAILIKKGSKGKLKLEGGRITNTGGKHGIWVKIESGNTAKANETTAEEIITIDGGYLVGNGKKEELGGAIYMQSGELNINDGVIARNTGKAGGGIRADKGVEVNIKGGMIASNSSKNSGGGIYSMNAKIKIEDDANIIANSAVTEGGGITSFGADSYFELWNGCVAGNTAQSGGGVYFGNSNQVNYFGVNFKVTNNSATDGGGIYIDNAASRFDGTKIFANSASNEGGGVYFKNIAATILPSSNNIFIALNHSKGNASNSVYPLDKISALKNGSNFFIEGAMDKDGIQVRVNSCAELVNAINEANNAESSSDNKNKTIELTQLIEITQPIIVENGANIVIILNGNDISGKSINDYLFSVSGAGSSLTIRNKQKNEAEKIIKEGWKVSLDKVGEPGIFDKGTNQLVYYVTKSNPISDPNDVTKITGKTTETTYAYKIDLNNINDPIGTITGNDIDSVIKADNGGKVTIEGGIITGAKHGIKLGNKAAMVMRGGYIVGCGSEVSSIDNTTTKDDGNSPENGAGIYADGAAGIQIFDGVIAGNTTPKRGGGIFSNAGIVEIKGGILAANIAGNIGGGICAQGTTVTTIGNSIKNETEAIPSLVISGNTAKAREILSDKKGNVNLGGGGIFTGSTAKLFILQNAYITNNRAEGIPEITTDGIRDGGNLGGGGVLSCGEVKMSGSFVTANYSAASGGGIFSYSGQDNAESTFSGKITLTGGIIAGNYAEHSEGGGLRINWRGEIKSAEGNKMMLGSNRQ